MLLNLKIYLLKLIIYNSKREINSNLLSEHSRTIKFVFDMMINIFCIVSAIILIKFFQNNAIDLGVWKATGLFFVVIGSFMLLILATKKLVTVNYEPNYHLENNLSKAEMKLKKLIEQKEIDTLYKIGSSIKSRKNSIL